MRVDTKDINPAFLDIIRNPAQRIFLDANFFISPDRSKVAKVKSICIKAESMIIKR